MTRIVEIVLAVDSKFPKGVHDVSHKSNLNNVACIEDKRANPSLDEGKYQLTKIEGGAFRYDESQRV